MNRGMCIDSAASVKGSEMSGSALSPAIPLPTHSSRTMRLTVQLLPAACSNPNPNQTKIFISSRTFHFSSSLTLTMLDGIREANDTQQHALQPQQHMSCCAPSLQSMAAVTSFVSAAYPFWKGTRKVHTLNRNIEG